MRTEFDSPDDILDEHERRYLGWIRKNGFGMTHVFESEDYPTFTYSTGFWYTLGVPEVIVLGKSRENANGSIWSVFDAVKEFGELGRIQEKDVIYTNLRSALLPVAKEHYRDHLGWSIWFYCDDDFPCLQLITPDRDDIFPWEPGYDADFMSAQLDLTDGNWAGFKTPIN